MEITKTIVIEKELADRITELAKRERRSFAREAQVLLEASLERFGYQKSASKQESPKSA
jgi:hypothetical protein